MTVFDYQQSEALKKLFETLVPALANKIFQAIPGQLEPEKLVEKAGQVLGDEVKQALTKTFQEADSPLLEGLVALIFDELGNQEIVDAVVNPLAQKIGEWFQQNEDAQNLLVRAVVEELDWDWLGEAVAKGVTNRLQIATE